MFPPSRVRRYLGPAGRTIPVQLMQRFSAVSVVSAESSETKLTFDSCNK
jgi:hypothetical protein